jgi:beta-N-acetylhexosaminidase
MSVGLLAAFLAVVGALPGLVFSGSPVAAQEQPTGGASSEATTARLAGGDRTATAAALARAAFPDGSEHAVVVRAGDFPDALTASALSGALDAPILLTAVEALSAPTAAALEELGVDRITVLGGKRAVSPSVADQLSAYGEVSRRAGVDRFATAAAAAERVVQNGPVARADQTRTALVATGQSFPDALAGGPIAGADPPRPLLLATSDSLPGATRAALDELGIGHATVLGGRGAVSEQVTAELRAESVTVDRVAGATRLETAVAVNRRLRPESATGREAVLARGDEAADALAVAPYAARRGAPLLLAAAPDQLGGPTADELARRANSSRPIEQLTAAGGSHALAPGTLAVAAAARGGSRPERCAARTAAGMTQAQRIGELFMAGAPARNPALAYSAIANEHAGAVLLVGDWYGQGEVSQAVARLQSLAPPGRPLLVAADQEGGLVQDLEGPGFSDIPSAVVQGDLAPAELQQRAEIWGAELARVGVSLNLSPVLGTVPASRTDSNEPIGRLDRNYGTTPEAVASSGVAYIQGMQNAATDAVAKHFPGLGRASGNTDQTAGVTDPTTPDDAYLHPFRAAVDAGARYVMVSSATYPAIDPDRRALFSPTVIGDLLRGGLGFDGVVMTDDVGNAAELAAVPPAQRALGFFAAGGDLVLTLDNDELPAMNIAAAAQAQRDPAFQRTLDTSTLRVLTARVEGGIQPCL